MRQVVAVVLGALAAAAGGFVVGEYAFTGATPFVAGVLFGLVISEIVVTVARRKTVVLGLVSAVMAVAGLAYAVWDDSGYGVRPVATSAWVGVALAAVVAAVRGGVWPAPRKSSEQ
jgi:peptidoglycan/LPS O-acetylase OafA/YrhL